jgi:hypothetical protein
VSIIVLLSVLFKVDPTEQALVLRFKSGTIISALKSHGGLHP